MYNSFASLQTIVQRDAISDSSRLPRYWKQILPRRGQTRNRDLVRDFLCQMDLKKLWCMKIPVTISSFSRKARGNITDLQHQFSLDWAITRHLNSTENTLLMSSMKPINGTRSTFYWTGKRNRLPFLSTANTLLMYHSIATSGTKPSHSLIASKRASSIRYPFTL